MMLKSQYESGKGVGMWEPVWREERKRKYQEDNKASVQFSSVTRSCPTLGDPMNRSTPGLPVHHQLPEFTQLVLGDI